jgi:hypothetical protein
VSVWLLCFSRERTANDPIQVLLRRVQIIKIMPIVMCHSIKEPISLIFPFVSDVNYVLHRDLSEISGKILAIFAQIWDIDLLLNL